MLIFKYPERNCTSRTVVTWLIGPYLIVSYLRTALDSSSNQPNMRKHNKTQIIVGINSKRIQFTMRLYVRLYLSRNFNKQQSSRRMVGCSSLEIDISVNKSKNPYLVQLHILLNNSKIYNSHETLSSF